MAHVRRDTKTIYIVRGLPGSGKSTMARDMAKHMTHTTLIEADKLADSSLSYLIDLIVPTLAGSTVILDGMFPLKSQVLRIFAAICDEYPGIPIFMKTDEPSNVWSKDPRECWKKAWKRNSADHSGQVGLREIYDIARRWEDVDAILYRRGANTEAR